MGTCSRPCHAAVQSGTALDRKNLNADEVSLLGLFLDENMKALDPTLMSLAQTLTAVVMSWGGYSQVRVDSFV